MHEDYLDDAIPIDLGVDQIRVHVFSPVDLAEIEESGLVQCGGGLY